MDALVLQLLKFLIQALFEAFFLINQPLSDLVYHIKALLKLNRIIYLVR